MKFISFELTMPNNNSWNGRWSGESNKHYIVRKFKDDEADKIMEGAKSHPIYEGFIVRREINKTNPQKSWYYNFGDGWGARITAEVIDSKEKTKRVKKSSGFCGYDWMVTSIIKHDDIVIEKICDRCKTVCLVDGHSKSIKFENRWIYLCDDCIVKYEAYMKEKG